MATDPGPCLHCKRRVAFGPRGLCSPCYYSPGVRDQYPDRRLRGGKSQGKLVACKRCGEVRKYHCRGLCAACYQRHKDEFPSGNPKRDDPTLEELDKLIEERRASAPAWFREEAERQEALKPTPIPFVCFRPRGQRVMRKVPGSRK